MSLATLQERTTQLVLQRSQAKDIVEGTERELGAVQFAIRELTAQIEEQKKAAAEAEEQAAAEHSALAGEGNGPSELED